MTAGQKTKRARRGYRSPLVGWVFTADEMDRMEKAKAEADEYMRKMSAFAPSSARSFESISKSEEKEYFDVISADAAAFLGISLSQLSRLARGGVIPREKHGNFMYSMPSLRRYKENNNQINNTII